MEDLEILKEGKHHNQKSVYVSQDGRSAEWVIKEYRALSDIQTIVDLQKENAELKKQLNAKSPLEREATPTLFIGSNLTVCTHRVGMSDIPVWCKGDDALNLIHLLDSVFEEVRSEGE